MMYILIKVGLISRQEVKNSNNASFIFGSQVNVLFFIFRIIKMKISKI